MIYKIVTFALIGTTLKTFEPMPTLIKKEQGHGQKAKVVEKDSGLEALQTRFWDYSESNTGAIPHTEKLLPYFANVIEDLPGSAPKGMKPKIYKNCQLLSEKHGGYLQFFHPTSGETLRIAMNSNYYEPIVKS